MSAHLLVAVGGERYALPIQEVVEVAPVGELTPVPGAPHVVMGVQNLRGQVVPMVDLGALLQTRARGGRRAVVVVRDDGERTGLAVDAVLDIGPVAAQPRQDVDAPLVGSAVVDGWLVGVVDVPSALRLARDAA